MALAARVMHKWGVLGETDLPLSGTWRSLHWAQAQPSITRHRALSVNAAKQYHKTQRGGNMWELISFESVHAYHISIMHDQNLSNINRKPACSMQPALVNSCRKRHVTHLPPRLYLYLFITLLFVIILRLWQILDGNKSCACVTPTRSISIH